MTDTRIHRLACALFFAFCLAGGNELRAQNNDPDLPEFMQDRMSKEEYLQRREGHIGLIRGLPYNLSYDPRVKAINEMQQQSRLTRAKVSSTAWIPIGPAPLPNGQTTPASAVSGRVTCIAVHPTNPGIVYVGTAQGGVYRTVNGGTNWTPIFDDALSLAIGAIAIAPSNPTIVYVGTGEANGSADSYAGVGLYRIDNADTSPILVGPINPIRNYLDAGSTPQSAPVFNGRSISKILVLPGDPSTIFVGVAGGVIGLGGEVPLGNSIPPLGLRGLYKLTNATGAPASVAVTRIPISIAGSCFDNPCTGNRNVNDMVFDPGDPTGNSLIVWLNGTNAANDGGVWRSTNAMSGSPSFTQSFATTSTSTSNGRGALAIYKRGGNPAVVYAASGEPSTGTNCGSSSQSGALRVSTDGGVTFSSKLPGGGGFCGGQCFYNIGLAVVPGATTSTDRIHIGGNVTSTTCQRLHAISFDGGGTFANFDAGLHADTHAITVAPSDSTIVYIGGDGGIFRSTNSGSTWASLNNSGFNAIQFQSIALHPTDPFFTIGGTQDNGTPWLKPDQSWIRADFGDGGFAAIDQNATDVTNVTMYHTYFNQTNSLLGFARITNTASAGDGLWTFLGCNGAPSNGINCTDAVLFYAPMVLGPGNPNTVYYGTDRLYRSIDKGQTNNAVSQTPLVASVAISAIAISPQDDNYRIVGLKNGALFYTTTGSSTMTLLDPTGSGSVIPDTYVGRVAFDPLNKNTAYIAIGGYMGGTAAANSHVWKVTNLSSTPVIAARNGTGGTILPDVPVNAFVVDPSNSANLYAGTDIGVYNSADSGATWNVFGTGLPRVAVFDMAIQQSTGIIRIATHGRGIWENSGPLLPIQLASFTVTIVNRSGVMLNWATLSEVNNFGFEVQKSTAQAGDYQSIPSSFVHGHGATNVSQHYSYMDKNPGTGKVYYRLKQLDLDGTLHYSDAVAVDLQSGIAEKELPTEFSLEQGYPNPFNPSAMIRYGLPQDATVRLEVYSILGQRVASLVNEEQKAGYHEVTFRAGDLASGAYFYTIEAGDYRASKKLVLSK